MSALAPTPRELLVDAAGRPYFLWDSEMTLARFEELLRTGDPVTRAWLVGKLMRQAKPDDVFSFVTLEEIARLWPELLKYLGRTREFWRWWLEQWGVLPEEYTGPVMDRLRADGLQASSVQSGSSMHRLLVAANGDSTVLDLVADPVPVIEAPERRSWGAREIQVDTAHEILVNKLCALIQRSELRDLFDVWKLAEAGGDLARALVDAPRKDGGFSPLTLAWLLKELAIESAGRAEGGPDERIRALTAFRDAWIARLRDLSRPDAR